VTDRLPGLPGLAARLDALDEAALAEHPDALEAVQAALVAELDALASAGRAAPQPAAPQPAAPGPAAPAPDPRAAERPAGPGGGAVVRP